MKVKNLLLHKKLWGYVTGEIQLADDIGAGVE